MKKKFLLWGIFVVFAMMMATVTGCGSQGGQTQSNNTGGNGGAAPIVIGVPTALNSIEGADSLRAVQLAADEINAAGGVKVGNEKRPLKIVTIDTREADAGVPVNDALTALEKMITEDKPDAILVGAFRSEVLLASMDIIAKYKIPYITSMAMVPSFQTKVAADPKYKYMFRMCINSNYLVDYLGQTMGSIGKEFNFNKAYIVTQDLLWAKATGTGLQKWLEANGWEVVGNDAYPTGASDFSTTLSNAKNKGAQVIVPIFDMPQAGTLVKQAKTMQVPALMAGYIGPATQETGWKSFNGDVEGLIDFIFEIGPLPVKAVPKSVEFHDNFVKKYGAEQAQKLSGHGAGPAYDSAYVLADAIERAGSLDPDAIVAAIEKTDMNGVTGRIKFTADHQVIYGVDPKETAIGAAFQWQAPGVRVPVFPEVAKEADIQLPADMKKQ
ncbi:MAG: ABC transporter substrate-binding protein [Firmicutes bacterium]|nr:ABC transporter substrate-binding protein [Bacillota bacterium]